MKKNKQIFFSLVEAETIDGGESIFWSKYSKIWYNILDDGHFAQIITKIKKVLTENSGECDIIRGKSQVFYP